MLFPSHPQEELATAKASLAEAEAASKRSEAAAAVAHQEAEHRRVSEGRTSEECGMLRRALDQALAQMQVGGGAVKCLMDSGVYGML